MPSLNQVTLCGNCTRDPEVKYLQSGTAVCDVGLAINDRYKNKSGEWVDEVTFVDITMFGKQAEIAGEYLGKGDPVLFTGKLKTDSWEKDGRKFTKLKVTADRMQLLGGRGDRTSQERPESKREYSQEPAPKNEYQQAGPPPDNEIPFAPHKC